MPTGADDITVTVKPDTVNLVAGTVKIDIAVKNYFDETGTLQTSPATKEFTIGGFKQVPPFAFVESANVSGKGLDAVLATT